MIQGEIARMSSIPKGYKMTRVGIIPEEWEVESISNLSQKINGVNPINNPNQTFRYIDVSCISRDTLNITNYLEYNGKNAPSRARKLIKNGDILFSTIRPYLKQVAKVPATLDGEVCSTAFCIIRCDANKADPEYVFQSVTRDEFISNVSSLQTGSNYPAVTDKDILSQYISLPPLPEQRRIAAVLSTVDAAIAATDEVIAKTEELKWGLAQDLLTKGIDEDGNLRSEGTHEFVDTKIGRIPDDWRVTTIRDYCESSAYGPRFSSTLYSESGTVAILRTTDLDDDGNVSYSTMPLASLDPGQFREHYLIPGDLLISRSGTCGIAAVFSGYSGPVLPGAFLIRLRLSTGMVPEFLKLYINSQAGRSRIRSLECGGVQKNLNGTSLLGFAIPCPDLAEQKRILSTVSAVDSSLDVERQRRQYLLTLKKGLMQALLTGRKRVPLNGAGGAACPGSQSVTACAPPRENRP